jgi:hypothetical protein
MSRASTSCTCCGTCATRVSTCPTLRLFKSFPREFGLADDPHPNAAAVGVMATWIAEELLRRGWVERGASGALPPVGAQYGGLRSEPLDIERIVAASDARRAEVAAQLRPALDFTSFEGVYQVYGTLNDDASVAMRLLVALQPAGGHVLVRLAPLESRPELYPLEVGVQIDGRAVGSVVVTKDGPAEARWPVPERAEPGAPLEVRLEPSAGRSCRRATARRWPPSGRCGSPASRERGHRARSRAGCSSPAC